MRGFRKFFVASFVALVLAVLPAPGRQQTVLAQTGPTNCSIVSQNLFVADVLDEIYYWYQFLPAVDPAEFQSPEAYLDAVRYRPLDTSFSYIAPRASEEAFFSDSQYIGFGFSWRLTGTVARVMQVFPGSPALEAGLGRGHRFIEINGKTIAQLLASGEIATVFGPDEIGYQVTIVFEDRNGNRSRATMTKALVTIPTVSVTKVYEVDGRKVGYIFFRNFVRPSFEALDTAFTELRTVGVDELVLDLRYNGGGLVSVAQHLGGLIGGLTTAGQVFAEYFHNDKNTFLNRIIRFEDKANSLSPPRLIVITTRGSASASELVINALRPFMPVIVIGDTTYGKPVGQYAIPFCDRVMAPVSFALRNARGEGDFFGGFAPDCPAPDDIEHDLGEATEGSLAEALRYVQTGSCSPRTSETARARVVDELLPRAGGWRQLVGAY